MTKTVYPEWVQEYRERGTTVKKVGNTYYLYKRTSKRVPGKKYPQPVDTYLGIITPNGVIKGGRKKLAITSIGVKEYGFSKAVWELCPEEWKKAAGSTWEEKLLFMIQRWSPNSYLLEGRTVKSEKELHFSFSAQAGSLSRKFYNLFGMDIEDLETLKYIYLVSIEKERVVSEMSEKQKRLLKHLPVNMEYK